MTWYFLMTLWHDISYDAMTWYFLMTLWHDISYDAMTWYFLMTLSHDIFFHIFQDSRKLHRGVSRETNRWLQKVSIFICSRSCDHGKTVAHIYHFYNVIIWFIVIAPQSKVNRSPKNPSDMARHNRSQVAAMYIKVQRRRYWSIS